MFIRFFKALLRDFGNAMVVLIFGLPALLILIPAIIIINLLPFPILILVLVVGWNLYFNWDYIKGGKKDD